eukprot:1011867_1
MSTDFSLTNRTKKRSRKDHTIDNNLKRRKLHQSCYNEKENNPFTFSYANKPSNTSKQSLQSSNLSYLNTCSPFQPSPINTAFQKLNEFWSQPNNKDINASKTENNKFVLNNYEIFDFNSLLKSLTKGFEEEKERLEFNDLAT